MPALSCRCSRAFCLALAVLAAGCRLFERPPSQHQSLLPPANTPDSVVLEVFSIHVPRDDRDLYDRIWEEVDEQPVAEAVRKRLAENGFRAGVVSGHLPRAVQRLLELDGEPAPKADPDGEQAHTVAFDGRPDIRIQQMPLRARMRGEIAASGVYEQAALLLRQDGQLHGQTREACQGMLAVRPFPLSDGRVRLQIVPEVHYGRPVRRYSTRNGFIELETGRPRKVFETLAQELTLSPGDLYVLSSLPDLPGSLGDYFLTVQTANPPQDKVLFVRLVRAQSTDMFVDLGDDG